MSRISVRSRLFGMMRDFFDSELRGVFSWDDIRPMDAEPAPLGPHGRRNPIGRDREMAAIKFSDYDLAVKSPEEIGPLGEIVLIYGGGVERGPIDSEVWKRLGKIICERELAKAQ